MITNLGALPGIQLHLGVAAVLPTILLRIGELRGVKLKAEAKLAAVAEFNLDLDILEAKLSALVGALGSITVGLPAAKLNVGSRLNASLELLGGIIADLNVLLGKLTAALSIGSIHAFSYTGANGLYAPDLIQATQGGFGSVHPNAPIQALILGSSSTADWLTLSTLLNVGGTDVFSASNRSTPSQPKSKLTYLGAIPAPSLLLGIGLVLPAIQAEIALLGEKLVELQASIAALLLLSAEVDPVSLAANLALVISGLASLALQWPTATAGVALDFSADLVAAVGLLAVLEPILAKIEVGLNGSIQAWAYHEGLAKDLGAEFAAATSPGFAGGQFGDHSYGLVLASTSIDDWGKLAGVLRVSA